MPTKPLILLGGGGHCKSVIDVAESAGYTILGILDKPELVGTKVLDYEIIGTDADIPQYVDKAEFLITVGQIKSPAIRQKLAALVEQSGGRFATIIANDAYVSKYAVIGKGHVSTGVMINGNCKIPEGMFIGSQSVVNNGLNMCEYNNMCGGGVIPSLSRVYKNKVK